MLCGYLRPSAGTAFINGVSMKEDIDAIHLQMGVRLTPPPLWVAFSFNGLIPLVLLRFALKTIVCGMT